jgi:hypothetical protein
LRNLHTRDQESENSKLFLELKERLPDKGPKNWEEEKHNRVEPEERTTN